MSYSAMHVMIPIFGLAVNILMHILSVRFTHGYGRLKCVIFGFLIGGFCVLLVELYLFLGVGAPTGEAFPIIITNLIIYGFLGYCYFHFVNLGETGRRVRILREVYDSQDGLTMEELLEKYNARDIVDVRLKRLLNNNQIILNNNMYFIGKPVMLLMSRIIIAMKLIILGKKSEFD